MAHVDRNNVGYSPYFRVSGFNSEKEPILEQLIEGSDAYRRIEKWVGGFMRRLFNSEGASGRISKSTAYDTLSEYSD